ncbi:MAG: hypothetical protein JWN46_76 [Acidimicrobiales bacterium]|nr:hypothetical protein [Acidimicrobiales bacterium]
MLPDPASQPTLSAREVAPELGIGINAVYREGRRYIATGGAEGIPAIAFGGRSLRFPTAALRKLLGLDIDPLQNPEQRAGALR